MTLCPNTKGKQCVCQPQDGIMCPHGPTPNDWKPWELTTAETVQALALARKFHEAYERLAPSFGYATRPDTREFNPESANGKLMIAVCAEIAQETAASRATECEQKQPNTDSFHLAEGGNSAACGDKADVRDAARYRWHCRNTQVAAWMGLDPDHPDVLNQLDAAIDAALTEGK